MNNENIAGRKILKFILVIAITIWALYDIKDYDSTITETITSAMEFLIVFYFCFTIIGFLYVSSGNILVTIIFAALLLWGAIKLEDGLKEFMNNNIPNLNLNWNHVEWVAFGLLDILFLRNDIHALKYRMAMSRNKINEDTNNETQNF